jgi:hypothetical protein
VTTAKALRAVVVDEATRWLGADYRDSSVPRHWPPQQFDCSTFTHWCWSKAGLDIDQAKRDGTWPQKRPLFWRKYPGYTMAQVAALKGAGCAVRFDDIEPGDLLYYSGVAAGVGSSGHHVVMYVGNGRIIHAAGTAYGVIESNVVPPGVIGHGGKVFIGAYSPVVLAERLGLLTVPTTHVVRVGGRTPLAYAEVVRQSGMSMARFRRLNPKLGAVVRPGTPVKVPPSVAVIVAGRDRA